MLLFVYQTKEVTNMDKKKESIVEEYLNEVLFKIDYFDNNHKYQ